MPSSPDRTCGFGLDIDGSNCPPNCQRHIFVVVYLIEPGLRIGLALSKTDREAASTLPKAGPKDEATE